MATSLRTPNKFKNSFWAATFYWWVQELYPAREWLHAILDKTKEFVLSVDCQLCTKYQERLRCMRNCNSSLINGIDGTSSKKDNVQKHAKSEQHKRAQTHGRPLLEKPHRQHRARLKKLFDICYLLEKREKPFTLYEPLGNLPWCWSRGNLP